MDFLTHCFHVRYKYCTIGCIRSAISAFHNLIDKIPVDQHPLACSLSGVLNSRRYLCPGCHALVLRYDTVNWDPNAKLSEKYITYKVVILMALGFAARACTIHHFNLRYILKTQNKYIYSFFKSHKSWRKGASSP